MIGRESQLHVNNKTPAMVEAVAGVGYDNL
jgi:hypothetical protein